MEKGLAGALAIVSLVLPVGWLWLNNHLKPVEWLKQRWVGYAAEFFYFVGLPYAALVFGVLSPQQLALKGLEHVTLISSTWFGADWQRVLILILVEWLVDAGVVLGMGLLAVFIFSGTVFMLARNGVTDVGYPGTILDTFYRTLHWVFYWALFWLLTGNLYLGILTGSGWIILEWILVAQLRQARFGWPSSQLVLGMILILTATIYFYRPNLWLLWLVHLTMVISIRLVQIWVANAKSLEHPPANRDIPLSNG
jgi:hypothetical protein